MERTTGTENWTPRQVAAYEALKASVAKNEAARIVTFGKAPKSGWTEADRVPSK